MNKKYQIFISSTYKDLKNERKKVQDTILSMYHFPIGMEMFSAADEEQWEIIRETIDSSDYYVLIIGHRYGSIMEEGEDKGISYTEKEYRYARSIGVPVLAFIIDESVAVLPDNMEKDEKGQKKLQEFISDIKTGRLVEWWKNEDELATKVMNSLNKQINRGKRPGWIRADKVDVEGIQNELLEVSKENRLLREEISELRKNAVVRMPELSILVNDGIDIEIPFYERDLKTIDVDYMPLSMKDVPKNLIHRITQEELDKYNNSLPTDEQLQEYKEKMQLYYRTINHAFDLNFTVENYGTLKANDIRIEFCFPDDIKIYRKSRVKNIEIPKKPKTEVNPMESLYINPDIYDYYEPIKPTCFSDIDMDRLLQLDSANKHFCENDNLIIIQMSNLLNGYIWDIKDKYCIIPIKRGTFEIECTLMCEEYSEFKYQNIEIKVI